MWCRLLAAVVPDCSLLQVTIMGGCLGVGNTGAGWCVEHCPAYRLPLPSTPRHPCS